eukprot:11533033-Heterocapsa_arctica.AAC.1
MRNRRQTYSGRAIYFGNSPTCNLTAEAQRKQHLHCSVGFIDFDVATEVDVAYCLPSLALGRA